MNPGCRIGKQGAVAVVVAEQLSTMWGLNDCYQLAESRREFTGCGALVPLWMAVRPMALGFHNNYRFIFCITNLANKGGAGTALYKIYGLIQQRR